MPALGALLAWFDAQAPRAVELHGYEKARRIGMMAMCGGKDKTKTRNATTPAFRDMLLDMARSVSPPQRPCTTPEKEADQ